MKAPVFCGPSTTTDLPTQTSTDPFETYLWYIKSKRNPAKYNHSAFSWRRGSNMTTLTQTQVKLYQKCKKIINCLLFGHRNKIKGIIQLFESEVICWMGLSAGQSSCSQTRLWKPVLCHIEKITRSADNLLQMHPFLCIFWESKTSQSTREQWHIFYWKMSLSVHNVYCCFFDYYLRHL